MPWLFTLFLAVHIGGGIAALTSFWGAILTRKGGAAHRAWGRVFTAGIYAAAGMALGMGALSLVWPLAMHPELTDADLYRGLFGWMMVYLALLTLSMTRYGLAMIANKRDHAANRRWPMVALQLTVLAFACVCLFEGIRLGQTLMILVSLLGFGTVLTYLRYLFTPRPAAGAWLPEHLKAMVATGISAYTAFLSVGLIEMFPRHAFNPAIWAIPGTIGMMLIIHFLRRVTPRRRVAVAAE
ncbi:hypothetical protein IP88_14800 [alpha proteobacterium AAP81b]|nr:hypothetical protein IP88_14800 [alpha proteobacterium AAP81b]